MALVYKHKRLDTNEIFYIGIELDSSNKKAEGKRSFVKNKRNQFWKNIVNKTNYEIEIIYDNLTNESAKELEIFLINLYGRRDLKTGSLVNLTDGGDGAVGKITNDEIKLKISNSMKGKNKGVNNPMYNKNPYQNKIHYKSKKIINLKTLEVFKSINEVLNIINIPKTTFLRWLSNDNLNKSDYRIYKPQE